MGQDATLIAGKIALGLIDDWRAGAEERVHVQGVDDRDDSVFVDFGNRRLVGKVGHGTVDEEGTDNV